MLLSEYAIKWWFVIPPPLTSVSALPGETWNVKAEMTHFQRHCLLVNMPFTEEDKILIKNLFELKGDNARHLVREFPRKS